jgi:predicted neuraminidase
MVLAFAVSSIAADPIVSREFIYDMAPFPECHASTIVETTSGLVAAWFGGTEEKHPDVGIWLSRKIDGKWTKVAEVANGVQEEGKRHPCWNPVLFQPKDGPLLLFYKVGPDPEKWWGMLMTSADAGKTWSKPTRLPEGILGPIKNKPVQLADGTILSGTSTEDAGWREHFEHSTDLGKNWTRTNQVNNGETIGAIQPSILFHPNGRLQAVGRTKQRRVFSLYSNDDGKNWSEMTLLDLPNPNAGCDAVTLKDGRHLLVYNHTPRNRAVLNVAVSDDGENWNAALALENQPGEFSYPAVIQTADGLVHITYTWKRQKIHHVALDPTKLTLKPIVDGKWPG